MIHARTNAMITILFAILGVLGIQPVLASPETTATQRLETCAREANAQALQGEVRREFLRTCMSGSAQTTTKDDKSASCRQEADKQHLDGAERRDFLQRCLLQQPDTAAGK